MTANSIAYKNAKTNEANAKTQAREVERKAKRDKWEKGVSIANAVTGGIGSIGKGVGNVLGAVNDPSWYNLDKQLVDDTARISFYTPLGAITDRNNSAVNSEALQPDHFRAPWRKSGVPGFMTLWFTPTIGISEQGHSITTNAVNVAAKNVYAYVRHANSGSANYESPDLLMYLLSMDSAYMLVSAAAKLYSIALTAKGQNRYYPLMALIACGMTEDGANELIENLSTYRMRLNSYVTRLGAFYVPNTMPVIVRHQWMVSNIFKDSEIKKSQEYVFQPRYYYIYEEVNNRLRGVVTNFRTINDIYFMLDNVLNPLIESESIGIMSGDILKAYTQSGVITVSNFPEDYHIESTFSMEVLSQITNAVPVGYLTKEEQGQYDEGDIQLDAGQCAAWDDGQIVIAQNTNGQVFMATNKSGSPEVYYSVNDPQGGVTSGEAGVVVFKNSGIADTVIDDTAIWNTIDQKRMLVNMYKDDPSPDDIMVATRLITILSTLSEADSSEGVSVVRYIAPSTKTLGGYESHGAMIFGIDTAGTEIINVCQVVYPAYNHIDGTYLYQKQSFYDQDPRGVVMAAYSGTPKEAYPLPSLINPDRLDIYQKFDWAPRVRFMAYTWKTAPEGDIRKSPNSYVWFDSADYANYAYTNADPIKNMHYVAALSEYGVPLIGTKRKS